MSPLNFFFSLFPVQKLIHCKPWIILFLWFCVYSGIRVNMFPSLTPSSWNPSSSRRQKALCGHAQQAAVRRWRAAPFWVLRQHWGMHHPQRARREQQRWDGSCWDAEQNLLSFSKCDDFVFFLTFHVKWCQSNREINYSCLCEFIKWTPLTYLVNLQVLTKKEK